MKKRSTKITERKKPKERSLTIDPSFAKAALEIPTITYSIPEVARILGISKSFTYKLVQCGELPSIIFAKKAKRILKSDLLEYVKSHRSRLDLWRAKRS